jgi:Recombinase
VLFHESGICSSRMRKPRRTSGEVPKQFLDLVYFPQTLRDADSPDASADAVLWSRRLQDKGISTRVVAKVAPPQMESVVAATVQVRVDQAQAAFTELANEDGALYLRRPGAESVEIQPKAILSAPVDLQAGEAVLYERLDPASYLGGEFGLGFWRVIGETIRLLFLILLFPIYLFKLRRLRRQTGVLARHPEVASALTVWDFRRLGWFVPTAGWSYTISNRRLIAYHGPVVQVVDRSRITGLLLEGEDDLQVNLACRDWNDRDLRILLGYAVDWWTLDLPLISVAVPALIEAIFSRALDGHDSKQIARQLRAERALGTRHWTHATIDDLISNPKVKKGGSAWGVVDAETWQRAQQHHRPQ